MSSRFGFDWMGNRTAEGVGEPRSVPRVGDYSEPRVLKERSDIRFPLPAHLKYIIIFVYILSSLDLKNKKGSVSATRVFRFFCRPFKAITKVNVCVQNILSQSISLDTLASHGQISGSDLTTLLSQQVDPV